MPARLIPLTEGAAPPVIIQRPVLLIGRHPECDVRLELPQISRRHCCLALAYDRLSIRDLGSRHGIRVNGRLVDEARLVDGDEVAIGPLIFRLVDFAPPPPPPADEPPGKPEGLDPNDPDNDLVPLSGMFPM